MKIYQQVKMFLPGWGPSTTALATVNTLLGLALLCSFVQILPSGKYFAAHYLSWMETLDQVGLRTVFLHIQDQYGPVSYFILWAFNKCQLFCSEESFHVLKLSQIMFFLGSYGVCLFICRDSRYSFLFALTVFVNSIVFSSIDIYSTPFLLLAFYFLTRKQYPLFSTAYCIACLTKYQPLIFGPALAVYLARDLMREYLRNKSIPWTDLAGLILPPVVLVTIVTMFFGLVWFTSLQSALAVYTTWASAFTYNLHWLISGLDQLASGQLATHGGLIQPQAISVAFANGCRYFLLALITLHIVLFLRMPNSPKNAFLLLSVVYASYLIFNVNIHINHAQALLPALFILGVLSPRKAGFLVFFGASMSLNLMLAFVLSDHRVLFGLDISFFLSALNMVVFSGLFYQLLRKGFEPINGKPRFRL